MNNLFKKIATAFVGIAMAVGVSVAASKSPLLKSAKADYYGATALSALTTGDVGVLVGNNGADYAMSNNNGTSSAPSAVSVTIEDGKITSAVTSSILWQVTNSSGNLQFKVPNTSNYLYCTNANNGLRVGTNTNNVFVIESNYLKNSAETRFVGVYNSADWRSYTTINNNIKNQSFTFYKFVEEQGGDPVPVTDVVLNQESWNIEVAETFELSASVVPVNADVQTVTWSSSDPTVATVSDSGVVTGIKVGTATITATTTEENNTSHGDCVVNVKEWNYGSETDPLTVSEATQVLEEVGNKVVTLSKMYVTGKVGTSEAQASGKNYRNVWLESEDGQTTKAFELYSAILDSKITGFGDEADALKGYTVVAHGWGEKYNSTYELTNKARGSSTFDNPIIISAVGAVQPATFNVTFDADGGLPEPAAVQVTEGDPVAAPLTDPEKDGFTFQGWYYNDALYDFASEVHTDLTLVAHWEAEQ